ncbi:MAG: hypothetical protein Kow006_11250 [Gammaproteobacteria bacterium]
MNAAELEERIRNGIPLARHMAFGVHELEACAITVSGGAAENVNVHGTGFAGSLYAIATLALWGVVTARLPEGASLVLAEGRIRYIRPVVGDIVARCRIAPETMQAFLDELEHRGRSRLRAAVEIPDADGNIAAEYSGTVHARLKPL